ncbi:MAG: response regulator transcription factor [Eubacteriales bacterium]
MIYCVEDDASIRELIVYTLKNTGYDAAGIEDGVDLFKNLKSTIPELILLDIMLPGEDGISILKRLKSISSTKDIPIILVTAKGTEYDKVLGLDLGADDYIAKPFGMMELLSRVKAVLRRSTYKREPEEKIVGNIILNKERHLVEVNNEKIMLTLKEFELLSYLMENEGIVMTRDKLLTKIWGYDFDGETRTVDVHIRTLRQKLGPAGDIIETVRGIGYRIGADT